MNSYRLQSVSAASQSGKGGLVRLGPDVTLQQGIVFIALHVPLAFAMQASSTIATLHALAVVGIAMLWLVGDREPHRVIYAVAYIVGAESLWRTESAGLFYELGKYAIILFLGFSLLKRNALTKMDILPVFYVLFLMPSIIQTAGQGARHPIGIDVSLLDLPVYYLGFDRQDVAFHLAGPVALGVASAFFSTVRLNREQMVRLLVAFLAPLFGLLALAISGTLQAESLALYASSRVTSAGGGPNQVSSILGLGTVAAFLLATLLRRRPLGSLLAGLLAIALIVQATLTFSRGGVWGALAAVLVAYVFLLRDRRTRPLLLVGFFVVFLVGAFILVPSLDRLTTGGLETRFESLDTTKRLEIAEGDLIVFKENPLFGVGPGGAPRYAPLGRTGGDTTHTEYTRELAEHGMFGILALVCLAAMSARRFLTRLPPHGKAVVASLTVWGLVYMAHSATRLAAPSFAFGLAAATFLLDDDAKEADADDAQFSTA